MRQIGPRGIAASLVGVLVLLSAGNALAQQACWQVASSSAPSSPPYVLLNQCTGQTWQLVRTKGVTQDGTVTPNEWVWIWQTIAMPATPNP